MLPGNPLYKLNKDPAKLYTVTAVAGILGIRKEMVPRFVSPSFPKSGIFDEDLYTFHDLEAAFSNKNLEDLLDASTMLSKKLYSDIHNLFEKYGVQYYIAYAKALNRKFFLHIGPTNSGKTYDAIKRLSEENDGVYLAPLRLLALEIYDRLNSEGVPCELLTGEEHEEMPGANITSSTIEMCNYNRHYKVAVIDEAQMIAGHERGANWTKAIYMIDAEEVHLCLAPEAENLITSMLNDFGVEPEITYKERLTPLRWEGKFEDISEVKPGDAFIVFSRKAVLELSAALSDQGISTSVIYGSLPPKSRREEVRKFTSGQTTCVVATDAIGMGLTMPIRRIIFAQTYKFDGKRRRSIRDWEITQIAGRAGRFGVYNEGLVSSLYDANYIESVLKRTPHRINKYTIPFPEDLIESEYDFSELFREWKRSDSGVSYADKSNVKSMENLYDTLKPYIPKGTDRRLIFSLISCPTYGKNQDLLRYWLDCSIAAINGDIDNINPPSFDTSTLEGCELQYRGLDTYHQIMRKLGIKTNESEEREQLCKSINKFLDDDISRYAKICKKCGRKIPFKGKKGLCIQCRTV